MTVGHERDLLAVGRPGRHVVVPGVVGEPFQVGAVGQHRVNLKVAAPVRTENDAGVGGIQEERTDEQQAHAADHAQAPGAGGKGGDRPLGHHPRQSPEGERAGRRRPEQERRRRRGPHAHQHQDGYQRNLKQQRHVDEDAQGGRDRDARHIIAQVGGDGLRGNPLDHQAAGDPRQDHGGPQPPQVAQAGFQPVLHAGSDGFPPRGKLRERSFRTTEPEGVAETELPPQQEGYQRPQQQDADHAHRDARAGEHGREDQRGHHQRRQVQRRGALGDGDGGFHRGPTVPEGGGYGDDARGTQVHGRPHGKAAQDPLDAAARKTRTAASRKQEHFRDAGGEERENHSHRHQLEVAGGEVPPPFEETGLRFPVDAKPLEALGLRSVEARKVGLDRVQLGDPVEGQEQGQNNGQQHNADDPLLFQRRIEHSQSLFDDVPSALGPAG